MVTGTAKTKIHSSHLLLVDKAVMRGHRSVNMVAIETVVAMVIQDIPMTTTDIRKIGLTTIVTDQMTDIDMTIGHMETDMDMTIDIVMTTGHEEVTKAVDHMIVTGIIEIGHMIEIIEVVIIVEMTEVSRATTEVHKTGTKIIIGTSMDTTEEAAIGEISVVATTRIIAVATEVATIRHVAT